MKGTPGGGGGLDYIGDDVEAYKRRYELKTSDNPQDWAALVELCKTLSQTPADKLEAALEPLLDIEGVLWFLAIDNALINNDGYWIRASDYNIFRDATGRFHLIPHDANETFQQAGGPGFGPPGGFGPGRGGRGPGGEGPGRDRGNGPGGPGPGGPIANASGGGPDSRGFDLDPLIGLDDARKPLRSKLLAVPALRARYLAHVRTIAEEWLDWDKLGPIVAKYRALTQDEIEADTRNLSTIEDFKRLAGDTVAPTTGGQRGPGPAPVGLRQFATERRKFLLNHPEIAKAGR